MRSNIPVINVYKKKSVGSEIVTQLLYGDTFKKLKKTRSWIKIKNDVDNYKGYIKNRSFPKNCKNTHKVFVLSSNLYSKPNVKYKINKTGSWIKIKNNLDGYKGFIKKRNFPPNKKNTHKVYNIFSNLYKKPSLKFKIKKKISFGSKIQITEKKNQFYKFDNFWIKKMI